MKKLIFFMAFAIILIGFVFATNLPSPSNDIYESQLIENYPGEDMQQLICGNNELDGNEQCDDGNNVNRDGCSSNCNIEGEISCEPRQKIGDVNGDGIINNLDSQIATGIIFGKVNMPDDICCIDVDQSGSFDVSDAVMIVSIDNNETQSPGRCVFDVSCGDGIVDSGEECDDGRNNGDKCDNDKRDCEYCSRSCKIISLEEEENHDMEKRSIFLYDNNGGVFCNPNWKCTGWNDCDGGIQTRKCRDTNSCEYPLNKPIEKTSCESNVNYVFINEESVDEKYYTIPIGLLILTAVLLLFILVFAINWRHLGGR